MGQIIRAPWGSGVETIDHDHEHLHLLISLAERSAINGDGRHSGQMLNRALLFLQEHAEREEHLLTRTGFERVIDVRRGHEQLTVTLEQVLAEFDRKSRGEQIDEVRRIADYLVDSVARDSFALRRFFAQPGRRPRAAAIAAVRA